MTFRHALGADPSSLPASAYLVNGVLTDAPDALMLTSS